MGGIGKALFGGSKSKGQSSNRAFEAINNAFGPALGYTTQGGNALAALLGLTGGGNQAAAQANFRNTPGYQFQLQEGTNAITGNAASKGLLNSGSTARALQKYGQGLADSSYQNYINNLMGLSGLGTQAGQVLSSAGNTSTQGSNSSSGGLGKALGFGLSLISDKRLKKDIEKVGEHEGLSVYEYHYKWEDEDTPLHTGVMAQEVAEKMPEALGLPLFDYMRVDYSKIPNWEGRD